MNISDFNEQFFNKLENDCDDHEFYLNFVCKKFDIVNEQEIKGPQAKAASFLLSL